jgi:hypothetical protein
VFGMRRSGDRLTTQVRPAISSRRIDWITALKAW